jgi:hypothetical protein
MEYKLWFLGVQEDTLRLKRVPYHGSLKWRAPSYD